MRVGRDDWIEKCPCANKDLDWNLTKTCLNDIPEAVIAGKIFHGKQLHT